MSERAKLLRTAFDRSFADAPAPPAPATYDFLRVRIEGEPYALALSEITSLHADLQVVAVPTPAPELLGIAAVRAALVPIYDLRIALGARTTASPRWTVLVRDGTAGFAFDGFDGHARTQSRGAAEPGTHARALVTLDGRAHSVIVLATLLDSIEARWTKVGRPAAKES